MSRGHWRAGLAMFVVVSSCQPQLLLCQPPAIDSAVYLSFFQEAAHQTSESHPVLKVDDQSKDLVQPSIQDAMGITEREGKSVLEKATGCEGEIASLESSARALVFESRLLAANEEKPTGDLATRLKDLDAKRVQIALDYVQRLRVSLGAERFKVIEGYIRLRDGAGSFFPTTPARKL